MRRSLSICLILLGLAVIAPAAAQAPSGPAGAAAAPPTPAEARATLAILQDPKRLAALIETLRTIAKAAPKPAPPASAGPLAPHGLGAQLLGRLSSGPGQLSVAAAQTEAVAMAAPELAGWLASAAADPVRRAAAADGIWRIAVTLIAAAFAEFLARLALRRVGARLPGLGSGGTEAEAAAEPWELLCRLPKTAARLVLELIPVALFAAVGNLLAGIVAGGSPEAATVAVETVNAYAVFRAIVAVGRALTAPAAPRRRLLPLGEDAAAAATRWLIRIAAIAVFGSLLAVIATALGLPDAVHDALIRLTVLVLAVLFVAIVFRARSAAAPPRRRGAWRVWLGETWPYLALVAIVALWLVLTGAVAAGLDPLHLLIGTFAVLVAARVAAIVALGGLQRAFHYGHGGGEVDSEAAERLAGYRHFGSRAVTAAIAVAAALALLHVWGIDAASWFAPQTIGRRLASAVVTVAVAVAVAIAVWEAATAVLDRHLSGLVEFDPARAVRLRTLLPLLRTTLLSTIVLIVALTGLSEIGVNIAPLLAGAGIVGIAVGFGAQTLVRDIITGMLVLLENAIQIGDSVTAGGVTGTVEELTVRTLRLRAGDGTLHIVPFSSVTTISNANRGIGVAAVAVTIAPSEDIDRACDTLKEIGAELRQEPRFAPLILADLELWGVDAVRATGVTIAGQVRCIVAGRWPVQREFNRRIKLRFDRLGIALGSAD